MGALPILVHQYFSPIFLQAFDDSCINFKRQQRSLDANTSEQEKDSKKRGQKRIAMVAEVQECLRATRIIDIKWLCKYTIGLISSTGILIYMTVDDHNYSHTFSIQRLLVTQEVSNASWMKDQVLILTREGRVLLCKTNLQFNQPEAEIETFPNFLPNLNSKRAERRLVWNDSATKFLVWWTLGGDEVFPWSPKPEQRANILVYSLTKLDQDKPSLVFYAKSESNLLSVHFSSNGKKILTIEESSDTIGRTELREVKYDIKSQLKMSETIIPLQSNLRCHAYDKRKEKLCLGLCDSSILISFHEGRVSRFTKGTFVPSELTWHEDGMVVLSVGDKGQVQMFDIALNPLFFSDQGCQDAPALTIQLEPHQSFSHVVWSSSYTDNTLLLLRSESGNLSVLNLHTGNMTLLGLIEHHMCARPRAYPEALNVLKGIPWDSEANKFAAFTVFRHLYKEDYSEFVEEQFEDLLEIYFNPIIEPVDNVWRTHEKDMVIRALSYHHWLLLAGKFKRSLEIAVKFKDEDCIRKLYAIALAKGVHEVADESLTHLNSIRTARGLKTLKKSYSSSTIDSSDEVSYCSTCTSSSESVDCEKTSDITQKTSQNRIKKEHMMSNAKRLVHGLEKTSELVQNSSVVDGCIERVKRTHPGITLVPLGDV